ncbi:YihY/virulence factor BrkB family protein [Jiella sp. M17.18]|uniref:YihY/virulence factor BrkB family protein n=1 Tax=Jiella sp. M17.18 TaxID=3234247 RepID=UPI0034DE57BB
MTFIRLIRTSLIGWWNDRCLSLGAALSFYTIFSMAPVLLISINIAGFFFGREATRTAIVNQIAGIIGKAPSKAVQTMLASAAHFGSGLWTTAIGVVVFMVLATGAIVELRDDLHQIWKTQPKLSPITLAVRSQIFAFSLVLTLGFLLLVSLVINTGLTALANYLTGRIVGASILVFAVNTLFSICASTALFSVIFKILPEVRIATWDVFVGAFLTALLFELGKFVIGVYIGAVGVASTYGAAGSLVTILLWVYYSSQILLFGAEFTRAYGEYRSGPTADPHAVAADAPPPTEEEAKAEAEADAAAGSAKASQSKPAPKRMPRTPLTPGRP